MIVKKPAIAPQIWTIEARDESVMSCNGEEVTRNPVSMVTSPAITDAAKAAVGFGCVLVANSYLTLCHACQIYQETVTRASINTLRQTEQP
jgi:hypothetical protein